MHSETKSIRLEKPPNISLSPSFMTDSVEVFYYHKKAELDKKFLSQGLIARIATREDHDRILDFAKLHYKHASNLSPFWMHHILSYGRSLLLLDRKDVVQGYILLVVYLPLRIAHGASVTVHPSFKGKGVGTALYQYALIESMLAGAVSKHAIIAPNNYPSLDMIINKSAGVVTGFTEDLHGLGRRYFVEISLNPTALCRTALDFVKLKKLSQDHSETVRSISVSDRPAIVEAINQNQLLIAMIDDHFITYPRSLMIKKPD